LVSTFLPAGCRISLIADIAALTSKKKMIKFLLFIGIAVASTNGRPQNDRIVFREEDDHHLENRLETLLPGPNSSVAFIIHPQAQRSLENGQYFQGDMKLLPEQEKYLTTNEEEAETDSGDESGLFTRTGLVNTKYRWPKNREGHVILPYKIDELAKYCE
jgi:hypothetical protein